MPVIQVPLITTQVFVCPTTADYDLAIAWLNTGSAFWSQHGIAAITGQRQQRRITVTGISPMSAINTDVPISSLTL